MECQREIAAVVHGTELVQRESHDIGNVHPVAIGGPRGNLPMPEFHNDVHA